MAHCYKVSVRQRVDTTQKPCVWAGSTEASWEGVERDEITLYDGVGIGVSRFRLKDRRNSIPQFAIEHLQSDIGSRNAVD